MPENTFWKKQIKVLAAWLGLFVAANIPQVEKNINDFWCQVDFLLWNQLDYCVFDALSEFKNHYNSDDFLYNDMDTIIQSAEFKESILKVAYQYSQVNRQSPVDILKSLILAFLYGFAYYKTLKRVVKDKMEVDVTSFTTFSLTSWGMVLVNWFVPWSLVYLESFILAWIVVIQHLRNQKDPKNNLKKEKLSQKQIFETLSFTPDPTVIYDMNDAPIYWNKKMEEISWYTFDEIQQYYKDHGEVMSLLYKWEEYYKVMDYLNGVKNTGEWYANVAFTMTTKSEKEITILWSNELINWLSLRRGRVLETEEEILFEKKHTNDILWKRDPLTGLWNRYELEESLEKINQEKIPKIIAYLDIDKFKNINDGFWHECGDEIIKHVVAFFKENLRENDILYRTWWDEFCILFAWNEHGYEKVMEKLNTIRCDLSKKDFYFEWKKIVITVSIWWDIIDPTKKQLTMSDVNAVDKNMYILKTLDHLWDILGNYGIRQKLPSRNWLCSVLYWENWEKESFQISWDFPTFQVPYEILELSKKRREENAHKNT